MPCQIGYRTANYFLGEVYLADLTPATPMEVAAFQAEHPHASFGWLADEP